MSALSALGYSISRGNAKKAAAILLAFGILLVGSAGIAQALDVTDNVKVDGYAKLGYAVEDVDSTMINNNTRRFLADVNSDYHLEAEAGVTVADAVRGYVHYSQIEHVNDTIKGGAEIFLSKFVDLPVVNTGVYAEAGQYEDRAGGFDSDFVFVGAVIRLK